ncbi:hypothetical protein D3C72_1554450 [compost metagenome]
MLAQHVGKAQRLVAVPVLAALADDDAHPVVKEHVVRQLRLVRPRIQNADHGIHGTRVQALEQVVEQAVVDGHGHIGMALLERGHGFGQAAGDACPDAAHVQSRHASRSHRMHFEAGAGDIAQHRDGQAFEQMPGRRQLHLAPAHHQRRARHAFELCQPVRHGRLRHVQPRRRFGQRARLVQHQKGFQMPDLDASCP